MSDYHDKVDRARRALEDLSGLSLMPHDIRAIQSACDSLNRIQGRQVSFSYIDEVADFHTNSYAVIMEPPPQFETPLTREQLMRIAETAWNNSLPSEPEVGPDQVT